MMRDKNLQKIEEAFLNLQPVNSEDVYVEVTGTNFDSCLAALFRLEPNVAYQYLPKMMLVAAKMDKNDPLCLHHVSQLIWFLDCNNLDMEENELRQSREQFFSAFNQVHANAIIGWLNAIKAKFGELLPLADIDSAMKYWSSRLQDT